MLGDKRWFVVRRRYGVYRGIDQSRYLRGSLEISLGKDVEWGRHCHILYAELMESLGLFIVQSENGIWK